MTARLGLTVLAVMAISQAPLVMLLAQGPLTVPSPAATPTPGPKIPADLPRIETPTYLGTLIDIDGKTHPELIPEYAAWTGVFKQLHTDRNDPRVWKVTIAQLRLTPREVTLLENALDRRRREHDEVEKRVGDRMPLVREATGGASQFDKESFQMILDDRQAVLNGADVLMSKLGPDAQQALEAYKADYVKHLKVSVPEQGWREYQLPR